MHDLVFRAFLQERDYNSRLDIINMVVIPRDCLLFFGVLIATMYNSMWVCSATTARHTPPTSSTIHSSDTNPNLYTSQSLTVT